jgi:hypothetical protein
LEVFVLFVDICGIVDHRCLEVTVRVADIDGITISHEGTGYPSGAPEFTPGV